MGDTVEQLARKLQKVESIDASKEPAEADVIKRRQQLIALNGLNENGDIKPGQRLKLDIQMPIIMHI